MNTLVMLGVHFKCWLWPVYYCHIKCKILLFFWFLLLVPAFVSGSELAVLTPDVSGPYIRVFKDIVRGIKKNYRGEVKTFVIENGVTVNEVDKWLVKNEVVSVIALGNRAMNISLQLNDKKYQVVVGAVLSTPVVKGAPLMGITMTPDPDLLFGQLKKLAKDVQSVSVVYQLGRHESLIARAKEVAASHGLNILAHGTDNARDGANLFKMVIEQHGSKKTAIWLLQDVPALKERSVLQSVLRTAWDQKILVFSSNPSYVKKGALFSLYPNNFALGRSLAKVSLEQQKGMSLGVRPSRDLDSVLNTRTAEHLGLGLSRSRRRQFDILFPSK